MKATLKTRIKEWVCKTFGHRLKYSHEYNRQHHYVCKRCGRIISKKIKEEKE